MLGQSGIQGLRRLPLAHIWGDDRLIDLCSQRVDLLQPGQRLCLGQAPWGVTVMAVPSRLSWQRR